MKIFFYIIICLSLTNSVYARNIGETEITAEDGIEVYQEEKYYLLKKNVKISSDNFTLLGDEIKISFNKDLYDIEKIFALGNVNLESSLYQINANGNKLDFIIKTEEITLEGIESKLITDQIQMYSDGVIKINNLDGIFDINGKNSRLANNDIEIEGDEINGEFTEGGENKEIVLLNVKDKKLAFIKNNETEMFANIIKYNKETSLIELQNNVKIISGGETVLGDYGTLNTKTNSYKIKSNNSSKVKVIITNKNE